MKLISWNVNGLRACREKGFEAFFAQEDADFFCIQETKLQEGQIQLELPGYNQYWHYADKKGYSGTAVFTKHIPLSVQRDFGLPEHNGEGRVLTLEYPDFYLVNAYVPNSKRELLRLDYRMEWEDALRQHLLGLDARKPVIYCGDLNVAHREIDLKNPKSNRRNAGFTDEERGRLSTLLDSGFTDTFRGIHLVVLHVPRPGEERRVAHRLFHRIQPDRSSGAGQPDLQGRAGKRPLPGGIAGAWTSYRSIIIILSGDILPLFF